MGLAAATQVFTELNGLKNAIFGQPMDALVTAPAGISTMSRFDPGTGNAYILSANSVRLAMWQKVRGPGFGGRANRRQRAV